MKHIFTKALVAICITCSIVACKKSDNNNTTPTGPTTTNPYYFKFNLGGTAYSFNSNVAQYISSDPQTIGGYQISTTSFYPSIGLDIRFNHAATNSDVLGLAGQTIVCNGANPGPGAEFQFEQSSTSLEYSVDTASTNYNVKIASVTYLKVDTTIFNVVDVYVIKGTCTGVLDNNAGGRIALTNGDFNFLISRVKQ